ncbi:MAG TPA: hypothetical protein VIL27_05980 [Clostridia bacterium]
MLKDIHPFNWKAMTITFIGTLNTLGTNTAGHNAQRIPRISEADLRSAGWICLNGDKMAFVAGPHLFKELAKMDLSQVLITKENG